MKEYTGKIVGITNGNDYVFGTLAEHPDGVYSVGHIGFKEDNIAEIRKIEVEETVNLVRAILVLK
jgi:hypothetical protein